MPRVSRAVLPDVPLHIVQRGNNRDPSFRAPLDYATYLRLLGDAARRAGCAIHAYVLMTNHVHLLVTPRDERAPARMMQSLGRRYVRFFNTRYVRTGTLWEGRYRSTIVDTERYFLACSRYIELNPVRARLVSDPAAYRWSSFRHNAQGEPDPLIAPHPVYEELAPSSNERQASYRALFATHLPHADLRAIRDAMRSGQVLGTGSFREEIEKVTGKRLPRLLHGGDRRSEAFSARTL